MFKKSLVFALSVAVSFAAFGCDDDNDSDDDGKCQLSESMCKSKGQTLKTNADGTCSCVPGGSEITDKEGDTCVAASYPGKCSSDGSYGFYCGNDGKLVKKSCDAGKTCSATGSNGVDCKAPSTGTACTANSTAACDAACGSDNVTGYYWDSKNNKVGSKKCVGDGNSCKIEGTSVKCANTSCTNYKPSCSQDGSTATVCNSNGMEALWTCKDNQCSVSGTTVNCPKADGDSGDTPTEECNANSTANCKAACDGSKGYFWNSKDNKLGVKTCTEQCVNNAGSLSCSEDKACNYETDKTATCSQDKKSYTYCTKNNVTKTVECPNADCYVSSTGYGQCGAPDTCTYGTTESACSGENNNTATYCNSDGTVNSTVCSGNNVCMVCEDGFVNCTDKDHDTFCGKGKSGTDDHTVLCTGDKLLEGGVVGNCCDMVQYKAACSEDSKTLTYCNSQGKVKTKSCSSSCSATSNTSYVCK